MVDQANGLDAGLNAGQGGLTAPAHQVEGNNGRFYTQAELSSMAHRIRQETEERVARQPEYFAQKQGNYQSDMKAQFEDQLNNFKRQWENEYVEKQQMQQRAFYEQQAKQNLEKTLNVWEEKKKVAASKYKDFSSVVNENELAAFPCVFQAVIDNCDNPEDVLYELSKNPKDLMMLESQRQREIENKKNGIDSNVSIKILSQMSKEAKDKHSASNPSAVDTTGVNVGMPRSTPENYTNSQNNVDLRTETNNYMNSLSSSSVLAVDRQGAQHVTDFEKMFKGQF